MYRCTLLYNKRATGTTYLIYFPLLIGPREQMNQATSFLDGSVVYGTSDSIMNQLRTFQGGELKMLVAPDGQELLPVSTDSSDGCNQEEMLKKGRYCFLSGEHFF